MSGKFENEFDEMASIWHNKLLSGEKLTKEELQLFAMEASELDDEEGEDDDYSKIKKGLVEVDDRFFVLEWKYIRYEGSVYKNQPYEVRKEVKVVEQVNWIPIKR